jgi:hypothetical protein
MRTISIHHSGGEETVADIASLERVLAFRTSEDLNEFWMSGEKKRPEFVLTVRADVAALHFFTDDDRNFQSRGARVPGDWFTFKTTNGEEIQVMSEAIVSVADGQRAAREFAENLELPTSVRWIDLVLEPDLLNVVRELVIDLASGRFAEVVADGRAGRLSAADLQSAISDYGGTLVPLPDEALHRIDVFPRDLDLKRSSMDVPLWTAEEGESDLTLQLDATRDGATYRVEITTLHVL